MGWPRQRLRSPAAQPGRLLRELVVENEEGVLRRSAPLNLAHQRFVEPRPGDHLFTDVDVEKERISLSIKAKEAHEEAEAVSSYRSDQGPASSGTSLGDLLKEQIGSSDRS